MPKFFFCLNSLNILNSSVQLSLVLNNKYNKSTTNLSNYFSGLIEGKGTIIVLKT